MHSTLTRAARAIAGYGRYAIVTRRMWRSPVQGLRYFWAAHRRQPRRYRYFDVHIDDLKLWVRPGDWSVFREIVLDDEYGFIEEILRDQERPILLDMGAHVGLFAVRAFRCRPNAVVYSMEASPSSAIVLGLNRNANPAYAWEVLHGAVWSEDGTVGFEDRVVSTSAYVSDTGNTRVRACSLHGLLCRRIPATVDLAKMDIEGAEEGVLAAAGDALDRIRCLIVEIHPTRCAVDNVIALLRRRYRYLHTVPGRRSSKPLIVASQRRYALPLLVPERTA